MLLIIIHKHRQYILKRLSTHTVSVLIILSMVPTNATIVRACKRQYIDNNIILNSLPIRIVWQLIVLTKLKTDHR